MNYCPSCGTANRDGSRFCNECGHKLPSKTGIICPMCSHMNPADNMYCDNCKARLVPLGPTGQPAAPAGASPATASSAAPIKKPLSLPTKPAEEPAPEEPDTPPESVAQPEPEADEPNWLVRLRAAAPKPSEKRPTVEPPAPQPSSSQEIPDWMKPAEGEVPDWFQRLAEPASAQPSEPESVQPSEPEPQPEEEGLPDWMAQLRPAPAAPSASQTEEEQAPDWLTTFDTTPPASSGAASEEELPNWLKGMSAEPEAPAPAPPPPPSMPPPAAPVAEEEPDWLANLRREPLETSEPAGETPDWLMAVEEPPAAEAPAAQPAPAEEVPDWLMGLRGPSQPEPAAEPAEQVPDWLIGAREQPEAPPAEHPEAEAPDWLSRLSGAPEAPPEQAEAPEWLMGVAPAVGGEPPAPATQTPAEEVPGWLRDFRIAEPTPEAPAPSPATPVSAFVGERAETEEQAEVPDWLSEAARPAPPAAAPEAPAEPVEVPAWLRDLGPLPAAAAAPHPEETPFGEAPAAVPGEFPEWLRGQQPGQPTPAFADESGRTLTPEATTGLEAATIPSWLQALKPPEVPGEAVAAPHEAFVETEGILAGLASVLPAAEVMGRAQGAPASRNVGIPAADLARAGVFGELLARGALAPTVIKPRQVAGSRVGDVVVRVLIALLLLVVAVLPNSLGFASSFIQLGEVDAGLYKPAADQVAALSEGQHVLMVFDYDAFQALEMRPIAEAFLSHLAQRGARATLVSLNPTGLALADTVLSRLPEEVALDVVLAAPIYYPGQAIGAQRALLDNPADLLVVLSGSPDSVRLWIEQVSAAGLHTPIVAGISAGALPQAQPYVQSGQVRGAVAGMVGGLAYQRALDPDLDAGDSGLDRVVRTESVYVSQLAFALILIAGMIVSLITGSRQAG